MKLTTKNHKSILWNVLTRIDTLMESVSLKMLMSLSTSLASLHITALMLRVSLLDGQHGSLSKKGMVSETQMEADTECRIPKPQNRCVCPQKKQRTSNFLLKRWKARYLENTKKAYVDRNETCSAFRFAELAFVLGSLAGRHISLKSGDVRPIYPNMYLSLVGRSKFSHKGESLHRIRRLLMDYDSETLQMTSFLPTAEGLLGILAEVDDMRLVCMMDEFKALFTKASQKSSEGLIPRLNEAFDCPPKLDNKTKVNPVEAIRPYVNLIGCLTPKWFEDSITLSHLGGGFINRFAFFLHEQMPLKSLSEVEPPQADKIALVKSMVKAIANISEFRYYDFSDEVKKEEKEWYHETMTQLLDKDDVIVDATARVDVHVIKIALLLAFVHNSKDNLIHVKEWEAARAIGDYLSKVNVRLFSGLSFDKLTAQEERVLKALDRCGGTASKTELSNRIGRSKSAGVSARDLQRILEALVANEVIMITSNEPRGCQITRIN